MTQPSLSKGVVTQDTMTSKLYDDSIQFFFWQKEPKFARYFEQGLVGVNKGFSLAVDGILLQQVMRMSELIELINKENSVQN